MTEEAAMHLISKHDWTGKCMHVLADAMHANFGTEAYRFIIGSLIRLIKH